MLIKFPTVNQLWTIFAENKYSILFYEKVVLDVNRNCCTYGNYKISTYVILMPKADESYWFITPSDNYSLSLVII